MANLWWAFDSDGELRSLPAGPLLLPAVVLALLAAAFSSLTKNEKTLEQFSRKATSPKYIKARERYLYLCHKQAWESLDDQEIFEIKKLRTFVYNSDNF